MTDQADSGARESGLRSPEQGVVFEYFEPTNAPPCMMVQYDSTEDEKAEKSPFQFGTWYPIESAPKDGSMVILARTRRTEDDWELSTIGWHVEADEDGPDYMGHDAGFVDYSFNNFTPGRSFGSETSRYAASVPTHWMPLPPPPSSDDRTEEVESATASMMKDTSK